MLMIKIKRLYDHLSSPMLNRMSLKMVWLQFISMVICFYSASEEFAEETEPSKEKIYV